MILYEKKNRKARKLMLSICILGVSALVGFVYIEMLPKEEPVFKDKLVLTLPDLEEEIKVVENKVQFILPYETGKKVVDYFDGKSKEIISVVEFDGVYRPSQGVDISNNGERFTVFSASDGVVLEVINDALLGNGLKIQSGDTVITYQSLEGITHKKGDTIKQKDILGKSSSNLYQPSLNNHLHIVIEKNGTIIDPNKIINFK